MGDITKETAKRILFLIRLSHPNEHGEEYTRWVVMEEIERRGVDLLKELGWWGEGFEGIWKNRYTATEETLKQILHHHYSEERDKEVMTQLFSAVENYTPKEFWTEADCLSEYKKKATLSGWL